MKRQATVEENTEEDGSWGDDADFGDFEDCVILAVGGGHNSLIWL